MGALFAELAYNQIHTIAEKNGWGEGARIAAHAAVGYIAADLANSKSPVSSMLSSGINEFVVRELTKDEKRKNYYDKHPDELQWISAAIGAAISGMTGGSVTSGASIAASGTKNNKFHDKGEYIFVDAKGDLKRSPIFGVVLFESSASKNHKK